MRYHCVNCLFSVQVASLIKDGADLYACRRYPPVTDLMANAAGQPVPVTRFPAVNDKVICGEYRSAAIDPSADVHPMTSGASHVYLNSKVEH